MKFMIDIPDGLHPSSVDLVINTAETMAAKLMKAQTKYRLTDGWASSLKQEGDSDGRYFTNEAQCNQALHHHINKGDPIDCINYLAFMNARGWKVTADQDALGCIRLYETAFDEMFSHCLSNGIYNQWGKSFDCTTLNLAHEKASSFLRKTI